MKVRRKFEPWYTEKLSKTWDPGENPTEVTARKDYLKRCFDDASINLGALTNALDFGGDLGQFFPNEVAGKKYLFDPSGVDVSDSSIERISDLKLLDGTCGLIMNCHTLEHLPLPSTTVEALRPVLSPNGYLFIELPYDTFRVSKFHTFDVYRRYITFIAKYSKFFMLIDFLGGVYRNFFRRMPFWGVVKQSEHINYYNRESLTQLCELNDLEVIKITGPDFDFGQGYLKLGRLSVIANAKNAVMG